MRVKLKFRFRDVFLGALLAVAIFAIGAIFWSSNDNPRDQQNGSGHQSTKNERAPNSTKTQSLWIPTDSIGLYTLVLAGFTGVLACVAIFQGVMLLRADRSTRIAAEAAQRQAKVMAAVEGPVPLMVSMKLVQFAHIPGEITLVDPVLNGPVPADCRIMLLVENKGRTPLRMIELCVEKFSGQSLPPNPTYVHIDPWGLVLEKGPIWIRPSEELTIVTAADVGASAAAYPTGGAFWVFGYFAYWNLLDERTVHKFAARWDFAHGFVPENRFGYT